MSTDTWSELIDDPNMTGWPVEPVHAGDSIPSVNGVKPLVVSPSNSGVDASLTGVAALPVSQMMASTSPKSSGKSTKTPGGQSPTPSNNGGGKSPLVLLLLLLFLLLLGGSVAAAKTGAVAKYLRFAGIDITKEHVGLSGVDGKDGLPGVPGKDGQASSATGVNGATGANGASGANGANGTNGTNGQDGSNACLSGLCVSRQTTTPGTEETGNINIDGTVLASQIGVNTAPTNTLSVGGTANISGHSAYGGVAVNGGSIALDALRGTTAHSSTVTVQETLSTISNATTQYDGTLGVLKLNPNSAPTFSQINGFSGGVQVESGNAQDFTSLITGVNGVFIHAGSGTVSYATGGSYVIGNTGGGTIGDAKGLNIIPLNLGGTITTYKGLNIAGPVNAGTMINNYGVYINDQSGAGSSNSYNLYSDGTTAKNYFAGLVGIGKANPTDKLQVDGTIRAGKVFFRNTDNNDSNSYIMYDYADGMKYQAYDSHKFYTVDGSESLKMTLTQSGKLGLGTTSPGGMLEAVATSTAPAILGTGLPGVADSIGVKGTGYSYGVYGQGSIVGVYGKGGGATGYGVQGDSGAAEGTGVYAYGGNRGGEYGLYAIGGKYTGYFENYFADESGGAVVKIVSNYSGKVNPALFVEQNGTSGSAVTARLKDTTGTCDLNPDSGSLGISCSSDERLKTNIREAASVLAEIKGLKVHDYTVVTSGQETTGLIAQEVLQTNPDMVHMGDDGYYKVDSYNPWKVLKAIQELDTRTEFLTNDFVSALQQSQGDIEQAKTAISEQGLRIEQLNQTLADYAQQLAEHNARIQQLESRVQQLEQAANSTNQQ